MGEERKRATVPPYLHKWADNMKVSSINYLTGMWFLELILVFTEVGEKPQSCRDTSASYICIRKICFKVGIVLIKDIYTCQHPHTNSFSPFLPCPLCYSTTSKKSKKKSQKVNNKLFQKKPSEKKCFQFQINYVKIHKLNVNFSLKINQKSNL